MSPKEWAYLASGTIRHITSLGSVDNGFAIIERSSLKLAQKHEEFRHSTQEAREREGETSNCRALMETGKSL